MKKKYHEKLEDAAQYLRALDGIEDGKNPLSYPYLKERNPEGNFKVIKKDTDYCWVSIEKHRIVILFQGSGSVFSRDIKDWINNIRAFKKEPKELFEDKLHEVGIHKGLHKTWKKFEKDILRICSEHGDDKEILVRGHSRGGGEAILCAFYIALKLGQPVSCITMGSLMVGDVRFRDLFRKLPIHCTEIIIKRDPVPKLPGRWILKYKHVGHIKFLKNKWWYYLPIGGIGIKCHVDYYNNILENSE